MTHISIRHKVADFSVWKKAFDDHEPMRKASGFTGYQLFRFHDDPNTVLIVFSIDDEDKVREFLQSDDLKRVMERAGVTEAPEVHFLDEA